MKQNNKASYVILFAITTIAVLSLTVKAAERKIPKQNIQANTVKKNDICADISRAIRNIRSVTQLQSVLKKYGVNKVRACEQSLKSDKNLQRSVTTLQAKEESRQKRKVLNHRKANALKATPSQKLSANRPIEKLRLISTRKIRSFQKRKPASASSNSNSAARIANITPDTIAPGIDVIIDGSGFGNHQGTVTLKISGKSFNLAINAWQDDWINIYLPETISRVHQTNNAVIVVKMSNHRTLNYNLPFIPIKEQRIITGWFMEFSLNSIFEYSGHSGETTVFKNTQLSNQWVVKEGHFSEDNEGTCGKGDPFATIGNAKLDSKIKWSHQWMHKLSCGIEVLIEGDKGFDPGVEESMRSYM